MTKLQLCGARARAYLLLGAACGANGGEVRHAVLAAGLVEVRRAAGFVARG